MEKNVRKRIAFLLVYMKQNVLSSREREASLFFSSTNTHPSGAVAMMGAEALAVHPVPSFGYRHGGVSV
jgi:hypothetical protein